MNAFFTVLSVAVIFGSIYMFINPDFFLRRPNTFDCWDLDFNRECDLVLEDVDQDGRCTELDCTACADALAAQAQVDAVGLPIHRQCIQTATDIVNALPQLTSRIDNVDTVLDAYQDVIDIGVDGATGAKGDTGDAGPTGATGAKGMRGATGSVGATGAEGPVGPTGPTGPAGTGEKGDAGVAGAPYGHPSFYRLFNDCHTPCYFNAFIGSSSGASTFASMSSTQPTTSPVFGLTQILLSPATTYNFQFGNVISLGVGGTVTYKERFYIQNSASTNVIHSFGFSKNSCVLCSDDWYVYISTRTDTSAFTLNVNQASSPVTITSSSHTLPKNNWYEVEMIIPSTGSMSVKVNGALTDLSATVSSLPTGYTKAMNRFIHTNSAVSSSSIRIYIDYHELTYTRA
jgi:hypothetical protein